MNYYDESVREVLERLGSDPSGLSAEEAEERLKKYGEGRLKEARREPLLRKIASQLTDPMVLVLIGAAAVSSITAAISGESFADVFIILSVVFLNAVLGVIQESKAESAIEALRRLTEAETAVIRGGELLRIHSSFIVPGDIVCLGAGDAVPADGRIISCYSAKTDESALTGESVPAEKTEKTVREKRGARAAAAEIPLGDRRNMVYMGSCVVYGRCRAVITATGMNTEMGKIAGAITERGDSGTPLQKRLARLSGLLTRLVLGICVFMFLFTIAGGYAGNIRSGLDGMAVLRIFMLAVSLAVAAIPEGLAAVVTVVLSIGVTRMSRRSAVIRKLTSVETLGCTQVICTDKTGTLTKNSMTVTNASPCDKKMLAAALALCSDAELKSLPDESGGELRRAVGDPTQCAGVNYAYSLGLDREALAAEYPRIAEIPFDSGRKLMTTVHKTRGGFIQYTTGAPDALTGRCLYYIKGGRAVRMGEAERRAALEENRRFAERGLRVIAAACREYGGGAFRLAPDAESRLCYLGLVGMEDPVRDEVPDALKRCREAGIRPVMITGDHIETACAIAMRLGIIENRSQAVTGAELDLMDDTALRSAITGYGVFARVRPEHKTRIVSAWRSAGFVTAMTGDGVNDAPSLKSADIGIGMGQGGTDVVKNVADIILADDNFATIASAVEEGRRIYDNICKAVQFLLSSNLSEVISIFAATLLGITLLSPVQILWINLITDSLPALALGLEKAEPDIMSRPPRPRGEGIITRGGAVEILLQGTLVAGLTLTAYLLGGFSGAGTLSLAPSRDGMTMAFLTMAMAEIFHSCNMRSRHSSIFSLHSTNGVLLLAVAASLLLTACVIFIRPLGELFSFEPITPAQYGVSLALAFTVIPAVEAGKLVRRIFLKLRRTSRRGRGQEARI